MPGRKYIKVTIEANTAAQAEELLAFLSECEYYAFEQENNTLNAYVKEEDFDEKYLMELLLERHLEYSKHIIVEQNWNQQWEEGFQPVVVHSFVTVRASFHQPLLQTKHEIIITPKMSFGTGHHATTFLMIEFMEQVNFKNKMVVDFGTGTGVLAILAEKCGASEITAIDVDEWSIENAKENISANNCQHIKLFQRDQVEGISPADVLLANINLDVLKNNSNSISRSVKKDGLLLISGFLAADETEIESVFQSNGFEKKFQKQRGNWLAMMLQKH